METIMEDNFCFRMLYYFIFILLIVDRSLQFSNAGEKERNCSCYNQCQKNFTNSIHGEKAMTACQRGCRFYFLLLHTSNDVRSLTGYDHSREGCITSCGVSYINLFEGAACNFGCSAVKTIESCDIMEHELPQITYSIFIEESDMLMHPGDSDSDDVLIDPGLRKQFEKTLETLLESKPKLPQIHFRNLPVSKEDFFGNHPRTIFECPKFYGFDPRLEFHNGKITMSDMFFLFSVLIFALICFIVSRNLEKQRKLWKQILIGLIQNKTLIKFKDNETYAKDDYSEKTGAKVPLNQPIGQTVESTDSKFEGITLVLYDDVDPDEVPLYGGHLKSNIKAGFVE